MSIQVQSPVHNDSLAEVVERILEKGVVIAGDISVSLVGIELLTIRLRMLIATVDKAKEMGINWWESDPYLTSRTEDLVEENRSLFERLDRMENTLAAIAEERGGAE
ncbi:MAG: gas vesicle protein [Pseudomonadota bacterium]